jgi:hypothetical protein
MDNINNNLQNLVALSSINNVNIFEHKGKWILKDKRKLIKECNNKKKKKIKEICNSLKSLANNDVSHIKIMNANLINDIEKMDSLIETIEKQYGEIREKDSISKDMFQNVKKYIEIFSN